MLISVIIPAFNEEAYLGETLAGVVRASAFLTDQEAGESGIQIKPGNSRRAVSQSVRR
jgi:hypothetical protein